MTLLPAVDQPALLDVGGEGLGWLAKHGQKGTPNYPHPIDSGPNHAQTAFDLGPTFDPNRNLDNHTPLNAPPYVNQPWHDAVLGVHSSISTATPADLADLNEALRKTAPKQKPWIRVTPYALSNILAEGRFLSQHESGSSNGSYVTGQRAMVERALHDVDGAANPETEAVIYGYVHDDDMGGLGAAAQQAHDYYGTDDPLGQYGTVSIRLSDNIRPRTTITFGDSLDDSGVMIAGQWGALDEDGYFDPADVTSHANLSPVPLDQPTHLALPKSLALTDRIRARLIEEAATDSLDWQRLTGRGHGRYVEAQYHGGVQTSDIAEVVLLDDDRYDHNGDSRTDRLDALNIPWRVITWDDGGGNDEWDPDEDSEDDWVEGAVIVAEQSAVQAPVEKHGHKGDPGYQLLHPRSRTGEINPSPVGARARNNAITWMTERGFTADALYANTAAILDRAHPDSTSYGTKWYAEAHQVAVDLHNAYPDSSVEQVAGVLAALSPRNKWRYPDDPKYLTQGNVADAYRLMDAINSPMQIEITRAVAQRAKKMYKVDFTDRIGSWVDSDTITPREQAAVDPRVWGLPESIIKAYRIAHGEAPDTALGGSKVRSFFNNIFDVDDSQSATIDSHQVRAMIGRIDLPDEVYEEVASNPARYEFFADVVRRLANDRGIPPHVVQAITWEQWRREHPQEARKLANPSNIATARDTTLGSVRYTAPTVAKTPKSNKPTPPVVTSAAVFRKSFEAAFPASNPYRNHVTHYTTVQLKKMKTLTSNDGKTGLAVKDHGDGRVEATALFNTSDVAGAGLDLLDYAVRKEGVNYLECFGPRLPLLYAQLGFVVTDEFPFDPTEAPEDWDYDRFPAEATHYFLMSRERVKKMLDADETTHPAWQTDAQLRAMILDSTPTATEQHIAEEIDFIRRTLG